MPKPLKNKSKAKSQPKTTRRNGLLKTNSNLSSLIQAFVSSRLGRKFLDVLYETLVLVFYIIAIAALHKALVRWVGENAKLLDLVPVRYIIDTGHVLVIGKFFLEIVSDIPNIVREMWKPK